MKIPVAVAIATLIVLPAFAATLYAVDYNTEGRKGVWIGSAGTGQATGFVPDDERAKASRSALTASPASCPSARENRQVRK